LILAVRLLFGEKRAGKALGHVTVCVLLMTAGAGHLLLRSQVQFANPFYPMQLPVVSKLMGWARAPDINYSPFPPKSSSWVEAPWEWTLYPWTEQNSKGNYYGMNTGLGPFFAVACIPAFLAVLFGVLSRRLPLLGLHSLFALGGAAVIGVWW